MTLLFYLVLFFPLLFAVGNAASEQASTALPAIDENSPVIRAISKDIYQIGNLILDKSTREIMIPGRVNMNEGLVEYLAVTPYGKTYESVLVLDVTPIHLQLALLLFDLDYGQNLLFQGDTTSPAGDTVIISVSWETEEGDKTTYRADEILFNLQSNAPIQSTGWVFTGSYIEEGRLLADTDGSIIATYSDPAAILNNPLSDRVDDTVYGANKEVLPPPRTNIVLTIYIP